MNSQEMMKTALRPGYWFVNVAPLGCVPDWQIMVRPEQDDGKLFGYDACEFMAKQYKSPNKKFAA